jgi:hemerythrin superfamily protein
VSGAAPHPTKEKPMRITEMLHTDHEQVSQLFRQLEAAGADTRQQLLDTIVEELEVHAMAEEQVFYDAMRRVSDRIDHAQEEHQKIKSLVGEVEGLDPGSAAFMEKARELKRTVEHHVREEEGPVFAEAERLGPEELARLGTEFRSQKEHLRTSVVQRGMRAAKQAVRKIA